MGNGGNNKTRKKILIPVIAILSVFLVILALYLIGSSEYKYSKDQMNVINELGMPDSFLLTFSTSEDGDNERLEEWYFHKYGVSITFYNGELYILDEIELLPENSLVANYEPKQFNLDIKIEDLLDDYGHNLWVKGSDYIPDLFTETGVELYYSEQIVVGFETKTNSLVYVESMILAPEEEEVEDGELEEET